MADDSAKATPAHTSSFNPLVGTGLALAVALAALLGAWFNSWQFDVKLQEAPVVNLADLLGPGRAAVVASLAQAARDIGVVRLTGHGVDMAAAQSAGQAFFALSNQLKGCSACSLRNASVGLQKGYIPFAAESGLADILEVKEGFCYGLEWPSDKAVEHPFQVANVWPSPEALETLGAGWRDVMTGFFNATVQVSVDVVSALADSLGDRGASLTSLCHGGETISQMRMFRYLPPPSSSTKPTMGSSPHTDWHVVTIIARDAGSSLQYVDRRTERWVNVTVEEDELILLIGDWLSLFTGGDFYSAPHRVQLPEIESSLAFVLFFYPAPSARLPNSSRRVVARRSGEDLNTIDDSMFDLPWGDYVVQKWKKVMSNR